MLSGIGCLFALRRFRVSFVRKLLVPMVLISLAYEFSQLQTAICCKLSILPNYTNTKL